MYSITTEAAEYVRKRSQSVYLDLPPAVDGCCFQLQESPSAKLGVPGNPDAFVQHTVDGIAVYVPRGLKPIPLTVGISSFLGFKKLTVEGWPLV